MTPGRRVSVVLLDETGTAVGALPPFDVQLPYWQEVGEVVEGARARYSLELNVLRLLATERPVPHGGAVTYVAQTGQVGAGSLGPLEPISHDLLERSHTDEPLRLPYAQPGGPAATVSWARQQLPEPYVAAQQRTWNLSAIWRLDAADGTRAWIKQVPRFFDHEGAILGWAEDAVPGCTPRLLARGDQGRMLLGDVGGEDLYDCGVELRLAIIDVAHRIQRASAPAVDDLMAAGVPDRRGAALARWIRAQLGSHVAGHRSEAVLNDLLHDLDRRIEAADACGLPTCLVHGDEHPGNAIGTKERVVIIDWGDAFIGNPAFDAMRLEVGLEGGEAARVIEHWAQLWRHDIPGCEPERAIALLRPVEALRLAAVYAHFLANIEPSERPYHRADVGDWLDRAADMLPA